MKKLATLKLKSRHNLIRFWNFLLLAMIGLLSALSGCKLGNNGNIVPAYGIMPMYGVSVAKIPFEGIPNQQE